MQLMMKEYGWTSHRSAMGYVDKGREQSFAFAGYLATILPSGIDMGHHFKRTKGGKKAKLTEGPRASVQEKLQCFRVEDTHENVEEASPTVAVSSEAVLESSSDEETLDEGSDEEAEINRYLDMNVERNRQNEAEKSPMDAGASEPTSTNIGGSENCPTNSTATLVPQASTSNDNRDFCLGREQSSSSERASVNLSLTQESNLNVSDVVGRLGNLVHVSGGNANFNINFNFR